MPKIKIERDTSIFYCINRKGRKPFLIFIHGAGSNHTVYKPFFEHFKDRNYLAFDIRNHGYSRGGTTSIKEVVKDLKKILIKERIKEAVVIGNCLGASIAIEFSWKYPEQVKQLILVTLFSKQYIRCAWLFYPIAQFFAVIFSWLPKQEKLKFQDYHKYPNRPLWYYPLLDIRGTPLQAYATFVRDLFEYTITFENITSPTLIILAEHDYFTKNNLIKKDSELFKHITTMTISGNHVVLTRAAQQTIAVVEEFIQ